MEKWGQTNAILQGLWMSGLLQNKNENFRLFYDAKGRFCLHSIKDEEAKYKLCKVRSVQFGDKGIPYLNTYDGCIIKFDVGMVTKGCNRDRVGIIKHGEKHKGNFDIIHVQDAAGQEFATRQGNVFTIGKDTKP